MVQMERLPWRKFWRTCVGLREPNVVLRSPETTGGGSCHCSKAKEARRRNSVAWREGAGEKIAPPLLLPSCVPPLLSIGQSQIGSQRANEPGDPNGRSQPLGTQVAPSMSGRAGKAMATNREVGRVYFTCSFNMCRTIQVRPVRMQEDSLGW